MTTVVNVKKAELNKRGIADFEEWVKRPNSLYIGRNMSFYVKGATASKWANPFYVSEYGRDECLKMYEKYVRESPHLWNDLESLEGKELGCWCVGKGDRCHGNVLQQLLKEKQSAKVSGKKIPDMSSSTGSVNPAQIPLRLKENSH